jgi:hypothetical protein
VALGFVGNEFNLPKTRKYRPDMGFVKFRNVVILGGVFINEASQNCCEQQLERHAIVSKK